MKQSEFIWLFGTSAVGKDTLIRLLQNKFGSLTKLLKIRGDVVVCEESLELVGNKCPTNDTRNVLIEILSKMPKESKSILIKGQSVDLYDNRLHEKLKELYPDAFHKIVFLWAEPNELYKRWKKRAMENPGWKDWGDGKNALDRCKNAQEEQLKTMRALEESFEIVYLNSTDKKYKSF